MMMGKSNYYLLLLLSISFLFFLSFSAEAFCFPGSTTCQVHHRLPAAAAAPSPGVDSVVEQICRQTSYPSVCISTLASFPSELMDNTTAILEMAVNETARLTYDVSKEAERLQGHHAITVRDYYFVSDCPYDYRDIVWELEDAVQAIGAGDEGTFTDKLNQVIGGYEECEFEYTQFDDRYSYYAFDSINIKLPPFNGINERLTQMATNCLNISTAIHWPSS